MNLPTLGISFSKTQSMIRDYKEWEEKEKGVSV